MFVLLTFDPLQVLTEVDIGYTTPNVPDGRLAWVFGVIRILYCVGVVLAVRVLVDRVIDVVDTPVGLATEPYTVLPASFVISTRDRAVADDRLTTMEDITSVPDSVLIKNESAKVADAPGAMVEDVGSAPVETIVK